MKILVTGASGFIGSRLLDMSGKYLVDNDEIIPFTSKPIKGFDCVIHSNYNIGIDDFRNVGVNDIDVVIHIGHFLAERHNGIGMCEGNISSINNTINLLKVLSGRIKKFIFCSSMAVYGVHRQNPVTEMEQPIPDNPYSVSKVMIEMLLKEWSQKAKFDLNILRLSHIYGPYDNRKYTIPIWLMAEKNNMPIKLYVNENMKKNCLYIDDCCRFILNAIYLKERVEIINLASSHTATMVKFQSYVKKYLVIGDPLRKLMGE